MKFNASILLSLVFLTNYLTHDYTTHLFLATQGGLPSELSSNSGQSFESFLFFILKPLFFLYNLTTYSLFSLLNLKALSVNAVVFTLKFILCIALLIFIRGGVPRYRYDFLTKIGWIKFLSLILSTFLISLILVYLF